MSLLPVASWSPESQAIKTSKILTVFCYYIHPKYKDKLEKLKKFPILKGAFRDHIHLEKAMKQGETYTLPMHPIPKL